MKKLTLILVLFVFGISCNKEEDLIIPKTVEAEANSGADVQDFMWKAMNYWYFWYNEVPNLGDDRFPISAEGSKEYTEFLLSEDNPEDFFNNKLRFSEDRFSFLSDDFVQLTNQLAGISRSNGLEFGLVKFQDSEDVFGYVRYIIPNSDAATKQIRRGDLFTAVNGQTLNTTNFRDLLFGESNTYTLTLASIIDGEVIQGTDEVTLTKEEGLSENPVFLDKVFEIGDKKIGYIVYNGFTNEYDQELNEAFSRLKSSGVTDLVLDLRYNSGGSVRSATFLSSMIYDTNTNDVFLKSRYNAKYQAILEENETETRRFFANKLTNGNSINSLNLSKVYVLTTTGTASASELVINGLDPYVDVIQIGETTRGKNEFSITMVDDRANRYIFSQERKNKIKSGNSWAIQPLIGRNENADGFSDYTAGLVPEIALEEDLANLGILGDQNEPLLARAIGQITGSGKTNFTVKMPATILTSSKMFTPLKDNMYVTELPFIDIE